MELAALLIFSIMMLAMFFLGFLAGILTKGININVTKKEPTPVPQSEVKYNESTASNLPEEVKDYYDKNNGFMNL